MKKPAKIITKEHAAELCKNYTPKYKDICKALGKEDNRSTWYSLEELKEYIAYIEKEGSTKGYNVDGIRFYLGSYSKNDKNPKKQNETTIFLAPTGTKVSSVDKRKAMGVTGGSSSDITELGGFNFGAGGIPPGSGYGG